MHILLTISYVSMSINFFRYEKENSKRFDKKCFHDLSGMIFHREILLQNGILRTVSVVYRYVISSTVGSKAV